MAIHKMTIMDKLKTRICDYFCNSKMSNIVKEENKKYSIILINGDNVERTSQTLNIDKKIMDEMVLKGHIHYKIIDISFDLFESVYDDDEEEWIFCKESINTKDNFMLFYNPNKNNPQVIILYKNINNDFKIFFEFYKKFNHHNLNKLYEKFKLFLKINNKEDLIEATKSNKFIGLVVYDKKDIRRIDFEYDENKFKELYINSANLPRDIFDNNTFERYIPSFEFANKFYIYHNKILENSFVIIFKDYMINEVKNCLKSCLNDEYHSVIYDNKAFVHFKDNVNVLYNYIDFIIKNKE